MGGGDDDAAGALDGFADEGGDAVGADFFDFVGEGLGAGFAELFQGLAAAFGVVVGLADVDDVGDGEAALGVHEGHAAEGGAAEGAAVVGVVAGDDDGALRLAEELPVAADHADDGVVGFGAGAGEEDIVEAVRGEVGEGLGEFYGAGGGALEEAVVVGEFGELAVDGVADVAAAVADVDAPEAGHAVEDLVAFAVP